MDNRAIANSLDNNQPYRKEIKPSLGSLFWSILILQGLRSTSVTTGRLPRKKTAMGSLPVATLVQIKVVGCGSIVIYVCMHIFLCACVCVCALRVGRMLGSNNVGRLYIQSLV